MELDLTSSVLRRLPAKTCLVQGDPTGEGCDVVAHVRGLLAAVLGSTGEPSVIAKTSGLRAARLQAIVAEIRKGFADPGFSSAVVARRLGVSPRYIQGLLQETGRHFTDRVVSLRLEKARAALENADNGRIKIIDVAYSCGFNDLSYFNRCFRRRFGTSPREFRMARAVRPTRLN